MLLEDAKKASSRMLLCFFCAFSAPRKFSNGCLWFASLAPPQFRNSAYQLSQAQQTTSQSFFSLLLDIPPSASHIHSSIRLCLPSLLRCSSSSCSGDSDLSQPLISSFARSLASPEALTHPDLSLPRHQQAFGLLLRAVLHCSRDPLLSHILGPEYIRDSGCPHISATCITKNLTNNRGLG